MLGVSHQSWRQVIQQDDASIKLGEADKFFENRQYQEAITIYSLLASTGNREAQFKFGMICEYGLGGHEQDYVQALDWYVKAVENGSEEALERINSMQIDSDCFLSSWNDHFEDRIKELINSCNDVGSMYMERGDIENANKWIDKGRALHSAKNGICVAKGYIQSQFKGVALEEVKITLLDYAKYNFEKQQFETAYILWTFLAEFNNAEAECGLGIMYWNGNGVAKNVEKGMKWLEISGEHGDVDAQFCLGMICESSEQDYAQAFNWYVKAAKNGSEEALKKLKTIRINAEYLSGSSHPHKTRVEQLIDSCKNIARMYEGMSNTVDSLNYYVRQWLKKANALENALTLISSAQLNGIELHEIELLAAAQSYDESMEYEAAYIIWRFLAKSGNAEAEYFLGDMYRYGAGVVQDSKQEIQWLKRSAAHGCFKAQFVLGEHYSSGDGVPHNATKAMNYFEMAVNNADVDAIGNFCLGEIYFAGKVVSKNIDLAMKLYKKAVQLGSKEALYKMNLICGDKISLEASDALF